MKLLFVVTIGMFLFGCGMSEKEKDNIAKVTCSIMIETRNMDAALRVKEINSARKELGEEPYLEGDDGIKEAFEYDLCESLVKNDTNYLEMLITRKEERAVEERIAAERARAEAKKREELIAATERGRQIYLANCAGCHMPDGEGLVGVFPPFKVDQIALNDKPKYIKDTVTTLLELAVHNVFTRDLTPGEIAAVMTYQLNHSSESELYIVSVKDINPLLKSAAERGAHAKRMADEALLKSKAKLQEERDKIRECKEDNSCIPSLRIEFEQEGLKIENKTNEELQTLKIGKGIYTSACSACHAGGVLGAPKTQNAADWKPRLDEKGFDTVWRNAIKGINAMPPMGTCGSCSEYDIRAAIEYMTANIK